MLNEDYFTDDDSRICYGTEYRGTEAQMQTYWTRSPWSAGSNEAWIVYDYVNCFDSNVGGGGINGYVARGVRPALCFDFSGVSND